MGTPRLTCTNRILVKENESHRISSPNPPCKFQWFRCDVSQFYWYMTTVFADYTMFQVERSTLMITSFVAHLITLPFLNIWLQQLMNDSTCAIPNVELQWTEVLSRISTYHVVHLSKVAQCTGVPPTPRETHVWSPKCTPKWITNHRINPGWWNNWEFTKSAKCIPKN